MLDDTDGEDPCTQPEPVTQAPTFCAHDSGGSGRPDQTVNRGFDSPSPRGGSGIAWHTGVGGTSLLTRLNGLALGLVVLRNHVVLARNRSSGLRAGLRRSLTTWV